MAVEVLKSRGVPEEKILFLNLIASPQGIKKFATQFPKLRVVTAFVDQVSAAALSRCRSHGLMCTPAELGRKEVSELYPDRMAPFANSIAATLSPAWATLATDITLCRAVGQADARF